MLKPKALDMLKTCQQLYKQKFEFFSQQLLEKQSLNDLDGKSAVIVNIINLHVTVEVFNRLILSTYNTIERLEESSSVDFTPLDFVESGNSEAELIKSSTTEIYDTLQKLLDTTRTIANQSAYYDLARQVLALLPILQWHHKDDKYYEKIEKSLDALSVYVCSKLGPEVELFKELVEAWTKIELDTGQLLSQQRLKNRLKFDTACQKWSLSTLLNVEIINALETEDSLSVDCKSIHSKVLKEYQDIHKSVISKLVLAFQNSS